MKFETSSLSDFDKQTPVVEYTVETDDNAY